jgi:hypothetical protein
MFQELAAAIGAGLWRAGAEGGHNGGACVGEAQGERLVSLCLRVAALFSFRFREVRLQQQEGGDPGDERAAMAAMPLPRHEEVEAELLLPSGDAPAPGSFGL